MLLSSLFIPCAAHSAISFLPPVSYPKLDAGPLTAADFDGDGHPDLAVSTHDGGASGSVTLMYGRGDGTFQPGGDYIVGDNLTQVIGADVNGDGLLDLLVSHRPGNRIAVFLNRGGRSFTGPVFYAVDREPIAFHASDLNGDGRIDLAVSAHTANKLAIMLNRGDGTFLPPVYYPGGSYTAGIASGDWNGDGKRDLAMANYVSANLLVYAGGWHRTVHGQRRLSRRLLRLRGRGR
jgi:hypothetical protein